MSQWTVKCDCGTVIKRAYLSNVSKKEYVYKGVCEKCTKARNFKPIQEDLFNDAGTKEG